MKTARKTKAQARRADAREHNATLFAEIAKSTGLFGVEKTYETDEDGLPVRLHCQKEEARSFLRGRRGFTFEEVREEVGQDWLTYWLRQGYVRPHMPGLQNGAYLITQKAAKAFDLPERLPCGMKAAYVPALDHSMIDG